jgi:phage tail sheath gpL-like
MAVSNPKVNLSIVGAPVGVQLEQQKILFIGQKTAAGTAISGALYQDLETGADFQTLFGENSMLSGEIRIAQAAIASSPVKPRFDAIAFSDPTGAKAEAKVEFTSPATADGTVDVIIGSTNNHKYTLTVLSTDDITAIGDKLEAAINADTKAPFTAANTAGSVIITAAHDGLEYNITTLKIDVNAAGLAILTVDFGSGAGVPDISTIPATIENIRYQTIVVPQTYDVDSLVTFLETRFNQTDPIIKDGHLIVVGTDNFANFSTSTVGLNKKVISFFPNKKITTAISQELYVGSLHIEFDYAIAAYFAAIRALRLTEGANISSYVNAPIDTNDNTGGIGIATLPYHNTPLPLIPLGQQKFAWTSAEIATLVDKGFSIFGNNIANNEVIFGDVVTRYKTNTEGQVDLSFKYLNYVDQASVSREYATIDLKDRFKNSRLSIGALTPRRLMADEGIIRAECMRIFAELGELGIMAQGANALRRFKDNLSVSIDLANGKVTINMYNIPVTQVRDIEGFIQTTFSIN